ncbi:MAG: endonuclease domain-containing protein [Janthinobacterium lividum]
MVEGAPPSALNAPIRTVRRARALRRNLTLPEVLLWRELRTRPGAFRFRRQHPLGDFVLDFACLEARLAIEVDGQHHDRGDQPAFDVSRDVRLSGLGFTTMRVTGRDVLSNLEAVIIGIVAACRGRIPLHHRPAAGGPLPVPGRNDVAVLRGFR